MWRVPGPVAGNANDTSFMFEIEPQSRIVNKHVIVKMFFRTGRFTILVFNIYNFFFYSTIADVDCSIGSGS